MERGEFLRSWRTDTGLSVEKVAQLARLPPSTVEQIESGSHEPTFEELDALADVLGLRPDEIYGDQVSASAPRDGIRILMKSAVAYHPSEPVLLSMLNAAAAARDLLDLRAAIRAPPRGFEKFSSQPLLPSNSNDAPFKFGDKLAQETRQKLSIQGPIASMRDLAQESLGIPIIAANLTQYGPDAFSVYAPSRQAAIVLNLQGKNVHPLVRRFSIAHEVGHILFDRPAMGGFGIACKVNPERGLNVESRANAFAMRLLLPYGPLKNLGTSILQPAIFRGVMEKWGVHVSALQLYVEKVLNLSRDEVQSRMPDVDRSSPNKWSEAEELSEERRGLKEVPMPRRGALANLILELVRKDQISRSRARELLSVKGDVSIDELAAEADVPLDGD